MLREIREWIHLTLLYGLLYSTAFIFLVVMLINIPKNIPTQTYYPPPARTIIYKTIQPILLQNSLAQSVCNRIDGCIVKNGVCLTCTHPLRNDMGRKMVERGS